MAIPESSPFQCCSTAAAMAAAALPAAATKVRPRGGGGRCGAMIFSGSAAATAARKLSSRSARTSSKLALRSGGGGGGELGVAVIHEEVGTHLRGELRCCQVVLHVGEADARRDAGRTRGCGEQRRLRNAPAEVLLEAGRGAVGRIRHEVLER